MNDQYDVSVIICTYNRCAMLGGALASVLAQETGAVRYEVIVVDNNSKDKTREVIESFIRRGHANMRYIFEGKQGLSHARNAGIAGARAPIIAFTDDDVRVAPDWVVMIKRTFDEHPEVDCIGGKVLPLWQSPPPSWLTPEHWSPLALTNYGEQPFYVNTQQPICLVGASLSVRRHVFDRVGLFSPEFQHNKGSVSATDDHEFLLRFWGAGGQGMYVPRIIVRADVQAERMRKKYHRKWHTDHGYLCAKMGLEEVTSTKGHLFKVPAHLYRQALTNALGWLKCILRGRYTNAFHYETELRYFAGFFRQRLEAFRAAAHHRGIIAEVAAFLQSFLAAKGDRPAPKEFH